MKNLSSKYSLNESELSLKKEKGKKVLADLKQWYQCVMSGG
jgi:hypothetical protein